MQTADFTIADVLAWARTKPADEAYPYGNIYGCAIFQFLQARGAPVECAGGMGFWYDTDGQEHHIKIPPTVLCSGGTTFGALADRLAALLPAERLSDTWTKADAYLTDIEDVARERCSA